MDASTSCPPASGSELLQAQRAFFRSGATRPVAFRRDALVRLRAALVGAEAEVLAALQADLGRPPAEAYASEVGFVLGEIDFALRHLARWARPRKERTPPLLFPATSWIHPEPYGCTLIVGPWNYPVQLLLVPLLGAIAAGNCAVLKPSELAPRTAEVLARVVATAFPPGHVAVVQGGVDAVQELLAQRFDSIFFTGGARVGRIVMQAAARFLTPVTLELGGKSPCIVDASADLDVAARRIAWGKFMNAGQTCVAPDFVLVHASVRAQLVERLAATVRAFYGDAPRGSPDFGRIVNTAHFDRLAALLGRGRAAVGGDSDRAERYIAPTVLDGVEWTDPVMQDEIFGPILPVLEFATLDAAIARVQAMERPLALYVFAGERAVQDRVLRELPSGGACVNDTVAQLLNPRLPFGGVGDSGLGGYHGRHSFETFSHMRSVVRRGTWFDLAAKYPPYRMPLAVLRRLMQVLG
ncbi:aldehyde dehydrogenase [Ramlibacter sp. USB13]|uniref:Aldehyde dehydrogenase n=1 Tax=Ramlibacter cellulosilyticus TaxID=2764187 RepID=A0A923SDM5_9BURK|nr:aldehyde dehydrogenase [Ramlibacter cellulosilyticus]MBC5786175.1 aldehyde dehydrogenase [Ramlibacter cellulosilyticus]